MVEIPRYVRFSGKWAARLLFGGMVLLLTCGFDCRPLEENDSRVAASRAAAMDFAASLKGQLLHALKERGVVAAIPFCHDMAPEISQRFSKERGWHIGRTSLKARNPANRPEAWEREVLKEFRKRAQAGEDPAAFEFWAVCGEGEDSEFRYMKAIPTGDICLNCHGSNLAPRVKARIDQLYPHDQATGFALGDLRGAITITHKPERLQETP